MSPWCLPGRMVTTDVLSCGQRWTYRSVFLEFQLGWPSIWPLSHGVPGEEEDQLCPCTSRNSWQESWSRSPLVVFRLGWREGRRSGYSVSWGHPACHAACQRCLWSLARRFQTLAVGLDQSHFPSLHSFLSLQATEWLELVTVLLVVFRATAECQCCLHPSQKLAILSHQSLKG